MRKRRKGSGRRNKAQAREEERKSEREDCRVANGEEVNGRVREEEEEVGRKDRRKGREREEREKENERREN